MTRPRSPIALVLVAAALCVVLFPTLLAGCGSDDGGRLRTYRNDRYHFSLTLEKRFVDWKEADVGDRGDFGVAFVDPDGARAGERHTDAILVAVVDLADETTPQLADQTRDTLRERGAETLASLGDDVRTWAVTDVTINGSSGIVIPFAVTVQDAQVLGWDYMLVKDSWLYIIVAMSGESSWQRNKDALRTAAESFTAD